MSRQAQRTFVAAAGLSKSVGVPTPVGAPLVGDQRRKALHLDPALTNELTPA